MSTVASKPLRSAALAAGRLCFGWGLFVLLVASCGEVLPTKIESVVNNPRRYEGKVAFVRGEVSEPTSLLFVKYFTISDKTGSIPVITNRALPCAGTTISVRGVVEQYALLGEQVMVIREDRKGEK